MFVIQPAGGACWVKRMRDRGPIVTATRLQRFIVCKRRPFMDLHGPADERVETATMQRLFEGGEHHEQEVGKRHGLSADDEMLAIAANEEEEEEDRVADQPTGAMTALDLGKSYRPQGDDLHEREFETRAVMAAGVRAVDKAVLHHGRWWGIPDWLEKRMGESRLGGWYYEPVDAKLYSRAPAKRHVVPLVFYALLLERIQGRLPDRIMIMGSRGAHPVETRAYVESTLATIDELVTTLRAGGDPGPRLASQCERCPWHAVCERDAKAKGDLSLLPDLLPPARARMAAAGFTNVASVAAANPHALAAVPGLRAKTMRLIAQARCVQDGTFQVIDPAAIPARAATEIFLDLETFAHSNPQPITVYGLAVRRGARLEYHQIFATDISPAAQRRATASFVSLVRRLPAGAPVFHYGATDRTLLARVDADDRARVAKRLVDLLPVVRNAALLPVRSRGLKTIGDAIGFRRRSPARDGFAATELWETWQQRGRRGSPRRLLDYNREDLALLAAVLERLRSAYAAPLPPAPEPFRARRRSRPRPPPYRTRSNTSDLDVVDMDEVADYERLAARRREDW